MNTESNVLVQNMRSLIDAPNEAIQEFPDLVALLRHRLKSADESELMQAAQAVIDRWDTPLWKDAPSTAEYIGRLRAALAKAKGDQS